MCFAGLQVAMNALVKKEVAPRQTPFVVGRDLSITAARARAARPSMPPPPAERLCGAVVAEREQTDGDEYADVPCTD
jgi:hypothetical protein